jgi:hypothetical protein
MCDPTGGLATAAVASYLTYEEARSQAKFQQRVQDTNADRAHKAAVRTANSQNLALAGKRQEQQLRTSAQKDHLTRETQKARGLARLSGAGRSMGAVLTDIAAQQSSGRARLDRSQGFFDAQSGREAEAIAEKARARSIGQYTVPQPSLALAAVSFANSSAVQNYDWNPTP